MYRNRRVALAVSIVLLISILLPSDLIAGVFSPNSSRCNINREIGDGQAIVNLFDNHRDPGCLTSEHSTVIFYSDFNADILFWFCPKKGAFFIYLFVRIPDCAVSQGTEYPTGERRKKTRLTLLLIF